MATAGTRGSLGREAIAEWIWGFGPVCCGDGGGAGAGGACGRGSAWRDRDRVRLGSAAAHHRGSRTCDGHLFVFRGRRGSLIKVLWHDGQGMCLFAKRLERGRFIWPSPTDGTVAITAPQLGYLLEGIDWRNPVYTWRPTAAG
jgi:hypothetical protein